MNGGIKQKLNVKSSAEAEVVMVEDAMPQPLWTNCFLAVQGFNANGTISLQDNKRAVLQQNDGERSSAEHTKHINVRCFL